MLKEEYIFYGGKDRKYFFCSKKSLELEEEKVSLMFGYIDKLHPGYLYDEMGIKFFTLDNKITPEEIILSPEHSESMLKKHF